MAGPKRIEIELENQEGLSFLGSTSSGAHIAIGPPSADAKLTSPMEMVLQALAGCSSVDVLTILAKQRAEVRSFRVHAVGLRSDASPHVSPFTDIELEFRVDTDAPGHKVVRAVELSLEKYCSVAKMLESTVRIRPAVTVNGRRVFPEPGVADAE